MMTSVLFYSDTAPVSGGDEGPHIFKRILSLQMEVG